ELDQVELLQALDGDGEHGPHAVVAAPDGQSLFLVAGNGTRLPERARSRVPQLGGDDSLLAPLPALMGSETRGIAPGGWIARTDLDGRAWELISVGMRNAYSLACDANGEVFTFDSDTEFELNLPWYRPTRVLHAVSGADFGWRGGALKVRDGAPDLWPALLPMGLGSPTAVLIPSRAKIPGVYRQALWVADWSYGKLSALRLQPQGATFSATREEIVSGLPLPITAVCVNPLDGALYFTTGGRRLHSALYRLRWTGPMAADDDATLPRPTPQALARRALESFHGRANAKAIETAWTMLGHRDPFLRHAARTVLESHPASAWRAQALGETAPRPALTALLALARADAAAQQAEILARLRALQAGLDPSLRGDWLRVLTLAFSRGGEASPAIREEWGTRLAAMFPTGRQEDDVALLELLVYCEAPRAAEVGVAALKAAVTREAQLDFAKSLRVLRTGWTPALRREFFDWLADTTAWRGGGTFARFLQRLRDDSLAGVPEAGRAAFGAQLAQAARKNTAPTFAPPASDRKIVRPWTTDELAALAQNDTRKRDATRGRQVFGAAGCFACHTFGEEGGALGPDLTAVARRLSTRDLIEAIVEPSREISDQYGTVQIRVRDGRTLNGRIVNLTETGLHLAENLADPANVIRLAESEIVTIEPSKVSLMPPGLLDRFEAEEILDLLAYLRRP
ncbi:MAG TPA: c-type cytochrome, partial [Opitutaceae bacterium]|nr:c-type cytochrome [Opitutaceae bacterium]